MVTLQTIPIETIWLRNARTETVKLELVTLQRFRYSLATLQRVGIPLQFKLYTSIEFLVLTRLFAVLFWDIWSIELVHRADQYNSSVVL